MADHSPEIIEIIRRRGGKLTRARRAIVRLLAREHGPFSAAEILARLASRRVAVNITTVYRELDFLLDQRLLWVVQLGERKKRYELATGDHHHHLVCLDCRRVDTMAFDSELQRQVLAIQQRKRFQVTNHALEFYGLCLRCQRIKA